MKKNIIILILYLIFGNLKSSAQDINIIERIREAHFDKGEPLDTTYLNNCLKSNDKTTVRLAKGVLGNYLIERASAVGEKYWVDLSTDYISQYKTAWFNDKTTLNEEFLVFDDLFRICMVLKKYYFFHMILGSLHDQNIYLINQTYYLYTELKTGNLYNFLDYNTVYKDKFHKDFTNQYNLFNDKVKSRILLNISAINFKNLDSVKIEDFKSDIKKFTKNSIPKLNSIEDILFNLSYLNFIEDTIAYKIANKNIEFILSKKYMPPFILQLELENVRLEQDELTHKLLYAIAIEKYDFYTGYNIALSDHLNTLLLYRGKVFNEIDKLHNLTYNRYIKTVNLENEKSLDSLIYKIDIIRKNSEWFILEPDWLNLKHEIVSRAGNPIFFTQELLNSKYTNNLWLKGYNIGDSLDSVYKSTDYHKNIDEVNTFHGIDNLIKYFLNTPDNVIANDTSVLVKIDAIYKLLNYIKSNDYYNLESITYDKLLLKQQLDKYIIILQNILFIKKEFKIYEDVCKIDDIYFTRDKEDNIDESLYVITSKARYLAFKEYATQKELANFDSLFTKTYPVEINKMLKDHNLSSFRSLLMTSNIKDVIFDIKSRKNISDSICLSLLVLNDFLVNGYDERWINQEINLEVSSKRYLINAYKNKIFCIDNTKLDTKKYINSEEPYVEIDEMFKNDSIGKKPKRVIDSSSLLMYFIANDLNKYNLKGNDIIKNLKEENLFLYGVYVSIKEDKLIKLISIDSLKRIFNFYEPKQNNFNPKHFFEEFSKNSSTLYDILLKPFDSSLIKDTIVKLISPDGINSIPIDYLFALKNKQYINFVEYGSLYKSVFKNEGLTFNKADSLAVFSEMTYNNIYCNLNKSTNEKTRSGIMPLKNSFEERSKITNYIKNKLYIKNEASKESFVNTLISNKYSIIHLITHGTYITNNTLKSMVSDDEALSMKNNDERQVLIFSSDSASKENTNQNNILTAMEVIYFENLSKIKLIFLSACETGVSDINVYSKLGYQGFVNNFLERGVKSIIATRWKVGDSNSVRFAEKYYSNLVLTKDFQKAFYETKKYFFNAKEAPFLWTSYVFVQ